MLVFSPRPDTGRRPLQDGDALLGIAFPVAPKLLAWPEPMAPDNHWMPIEEA